MSTKTDNFIDSIKDGAIKSSEKYGVMPSLVMAQAILESGWGESELFKKSNNMFGIKAQKGYKGETVIHETREVVDGKDIYVDALFRKYDNPNESMMDHGEFLNKDRYAKVLTAKNYREAAVEVKRAKYATDPKYVSLITNIIEKYELYKFDNGSVDYNMSKNKTIIELNAGHGGRDPGATGHGYKEKDLVLKVVLDLDKLLAKYDAEVNLTRSTDTFVGLTEISRRSNKNKADYFISVHLNAFSNQNAKGLETFHFPNSTKGGIPLATKIQNDLVKANLYTANRGVKSGNLSVLRKTSAPAALTELCFISSLKDLNFFLDNYEKFIEVMAQSLVEHCGLKLKKAEKPTVEKPEVEEVEEVEEPTVEKPTTPEINIVEDKVNLLVVSEHIAVDGFVKDGTNYIDVNGVYLGIRDIFENLQLVVGWNQELGLITADTLSEYKIPKDAIKMDFLGNRINVKMYLHKGRHCLHIEDAYVPVRDIFETLGFKVTWDGDKELITISK